ncbi:hypothetical protein [Zobellella sp. An-6]|uniref:hypothetical protein n=1 Tax=Zobellella sp. An-6 TaxID=3400218 RepID=UPI00404361BF
MFSLNEALRFDSVEIFSPLDHCVGDQYIFNGRAIKNGDASTYVKENARIRYLVRSRCGSFYSLLWVDTEDSPLGVWILDNNLQFVSNRSLTKSRATIEKKQWFIFIKECISFFLSALKFVEMDKGQRENDIGFFLKCIFDQCIIDDVFFCLDEFFELNSTEYNSCPFYDILNDERVQFCAVGAASTKWQDDAVSSRGPVFFKKNGDLVRAKFLCYLGSKSGYYFYPDGNRSFIVFVSGFEGRNSCIILLDSFSCVSFMKTSGQSHLKEFFKEIILNFDSYDFIFDKDESPKPCSVITYNDWHFGHQLWNDWSALERLINKKNNVFIDKYLNVGANSFFGVKKNVFEVEPDKYLECSKSDVLLYQQQTKSVPVIIGDSYISSSLSSRVVDYSHHFCSEKKFDFSLCETARNKDLVILITVRFDNRIWVDQEIYLASLIESISRRTGKSLSIIIDGKNSNDGHLPMSYGSKVLANNDAELIEREKRFCDDLVAQIKNGPYSEKISIFDTVGVSIMESIVWSSIIDFFICPWGAGMVKYKWISNKPGIVFSSSNVLRNKKDINIYDSEVYRESCQPSVYIPSSMVQDLPSDTEGAYRENFKLDIEKFTNFVCDYVDRYFK